MERRGFIARAMAALGLAGVSAIPGVARAGSAKSLVQDVKNLSVRRFKRFVSGRIGCDCDRVYSVYLTLDNGDLERWTLDEGKVFQVQRYRFDQKKFLEREKFCEPITARVWTAGDATNGEWNKIEGKLDQLPHNQQSEDSPIHLIFVLYPMGPVVDTAGGVFKKIREQCKYPHRPGPIEDVPKHLLHDLVTDLWDSIEIHGPNA